MNYFIHIILLFLGRQRYNFFLFYATLNIIKIKRIFTLNQSKPGQCLQNTPCVVFDAVALDVLP